jgi:hypothetical protein
MRFAGLAAAMLIAMTIAARPADAADISGTFTYQKVINSTTGATVSRPVAFARVEVWYRDTGWFDVWSRIDAFAMTDVNGSLRWSDARCRGTYALRVVAENSAATVRQMDTLSTFWAYPGRPGPEILGTATSCASSLDFSFDFADPFTALHFNIAETVRLGAGYANARRDPRESDSLPAVPVQPTSVMPNSYYDPVAGTVFIRSGREQRCRDSS